MSLFPPYPFFWGGFLSFCPQSGDGNLVFNPGATLAVEIPAKLLIANASSAGTDGGSAAAAPAATIDVAKQMNMMFEQLAELKGDLAAANGKIDALTIDNAELKTKLDNNLNTLRSDIAELNSTIANDVVEQDDGTFLASPSLCAMLGPQILALGGDPATPCVLPTELDELTLEANTAWMSWAPLLIAVKKVKSTIEIEYQFGLKSLAGLFPRLEEVGGVVRINDNPDLISIDGAFPALKSVGGGININKCNVLKSLAGAFPALESARSISITNNNKLSSVGTADNPSFKAMAAGAVQDSIEFACNGDGDGRTFCQSAKGGFCSLATSYRGAFPCGYTATVCCP